MTHQLTIRAIPLRLDSELRRRARETGKSLNNIVVETLARGSGLTETPPVYTDLDGVIGSWVEDKKFDEAIKDQRCIDPKLWS